MVKKVRESNIELFRIILMLMIIAHHYVSHGGGVELYDFDNVTGSQLFLELWGWGGKTGINCFLLITGYFMCMQEFTWRKFLKLYLEIKFYTLLFPIVFWALGRQQFSLHYCFETLFGVAVNLGKDFPPSYLALFLLVPFVNRLIRAMDRKTHLRLLLILLLLYTVPGTFFLNFFFESIGWYVTVYLIGAYLRLYPLPVLGDLKKSSLLATVSLSLGFGSILFFTYTQRSLGLPIYYLLADSNQILAVLCAVALFCLFKSINLGHIRWINAIATATFGVYLIHDQENVRQWLWGEVFHVKDYYGGDWLWLHAMCALLAVYAACVILDVLRQRLLEKPLFEWLDKRFPALNVKVK